MSQVCLTRIFLRRAFLSFIWRMVSLLYTASNLSAGNSLVEASLTSNWTFSIQQMNIILWSSYTKDFKIGRKKNHCFSSHTWLLLELSYALRAKLIMFVDRSIPRTWAWYVWNKTISWYRTVVTQMCMAIPLI